MGFVTGHEDYDEIVEKMRAAIESDRRHGAELVRMADLGERILQTHSPQSHQVGDPCPKCEGETFPCEIVRDFILNPD